MSSGNKDTKLVRDFKVFSLKNKKNIPRLHSVKKEYGHGVTYSMSQICADSTCQQESSLLLSVPTAAPEWNVRNNLLALWPMPTNFSALPKPVLKIKE